VSLTFEDDQYYSLDIDNDRLLIPENVPSVVEHLYPQAISDKQINFTNEQKTANVNSVIKHITDDPNKYLIVNANNISVNGDECNKVGVSYEAFYKQNNRCGMPQSNCLNNQPSHLWKHDMVPYIRQITFHTKRNIHFYIFMVYNILYAIIHI